MIKRAWFRPSAYRPAIGGIAAAVTLAAAVFAGSASYSGAAYRVIVVRAGDTLWGIARANGLTVAQLAAANHMNPNDLLLIGRHLVIPDRSAPRTATLTASTVSTAGAGFCTTTSFYRGPWGVLPAPLAENPARLALRPVMVEWADAYHVNPALVQAVAWQESGWQQNVVSPAGAVGVGQLLPSTARFVDTALIGQNLNFGAADDNIHMEAAFLAYLGTQVGDNPCMVAAAYYEGPTAVRRYGVFPETQQYVRDVMALESEFE